jgi:hypothetical protein
MENARTQHDSSPLRAALDWRLLLAWTLAMLVPTLIATRPLADALGELVDHVPKPLADKLGDVLMLDSFFHLAPAWEAMRGALMFSALVTLLLSPFLAGLAVTAYADAPATFFTLVGGAAARYGRMFRLMLVSLIPYAIAGGVMAMTFGISGKHAEKALLASSATTMSRLALVASVVALMLAQLTVEAARAQFAADPALRSALRAWGRGVKMVAANPVAALGRYLLPTLLSLVVAFIVTCIRIRVGFVPIAFLITQLAVATIGWGRAARIFALAPLVRPRA